MIITKGRPECFDPNLPPEMLDIKTIIQISKRVLDKLANDPVFACFFGSSLGKHAQNKDADKKDSLVNPLNKAVLSLSIKGQKQNANIVGIRIKNLKEISQNIHLFLSIF